MNEPAKEEKKDKRFKRKGRDRNGPARVRLASSAVTQSAHAIARWTPKRCVRELAMARWGTYKYMPCPHCDTTDEHYWREKELRWKCRACDKPFSVTSKTVFAYRKVPLTRLLQALFLFSNPASGKPALTLREDVKVHYRTGFVWQHKVREAFMRGFNVGLLTGDLEMDGSHRSGKRAAQKRGKVQGSNPKDEVEEEKRLEDAYDATVDSIKTANEGKRKKDKRGEQKTGAVNPEFGQAQDKNKRMQMVACQRSGQKGFGSFGTRAGMAMAEDGAAAAAMTRNFLAISESKLNTDTSPAFTAIGERALEHNTVEHNRTLIGPNGENNNQAESSTARVKRGETGVYKTIEPKYWLDYACEFAYRTDTRKLSTGDRFRLMLKLACSVGESQFWKNYCRGHHRTHEILLAGPQVVPHQGPPKGMYALEANYGNKPR